MEEKNLSGTKIFVRDREIFELVLKIKREKYLDDHINVQGTKVSVRSRVFVISLEHSFRDQ